MLYISQLLNKIIFSVQVATKTGAHISFEQDNSQLIYPNGAVFNITQRGPLYYLKNIVSAKNDAYDLHSRPLL